MKENRSMPKNTVIPVISYPDIEQAINWLTKTFNFSVRVLIGDHRAQLNVEDGCVVIRKLKPKLKITIVILLRYNFSTQHT